MPIQLRAVSLGWQAFLTRVWTASAERTSCTGGPFQCGVSRGTLGHGVQCSSDNPLCRKLRREGEAPRLRNRRPVSAVSGLTAPVTNYHNVMVIMLGEFEYLLISAAARLGEDAYGASIQQDMNDSTGRRCSTGALYTTLDRMESKGLLKTWMGDPTPQRGGRRKRMVRVTAKGVREAAAFYNAVTRASRGVSWETSRVGSDL